MAARRDDSARAIGRRVEYHRLVRGWTKEQLATHAEISKTHITAIEAGTTSVKVSTLAALARAFEIDVLLLFAHAHERAWQVAAARIPDNVRADLATAYGAPAPDPVDTFDFKAARLAQQDRARRRPRNYATRKPARRA